jgi:hypothetical protein
LTFKPSAPKPAAVAPADPGESPAEKSASPAEKSASPSEEPTEKPATGQTSDEENVSSETASDDQADSAAPAESKVAAKKTLAKKATNLFVVFLCIGITAICWGAYGPVLHKGQGKMGGSRLRPFLCVGIAYFAIAVIVPYFLLDIFPEPGGWSFGGSSWSLLAGAAGAIGALGIIYAFNFGGKPIFVMPLVFGFAPVVNTFTETVSKGLFDELSQWFYLSLLLVILGAVTVLICAPRGKPPVKPSDASTA